VEVSVSWKSSGHHFLATFGERIVGKWPGRFGELSKERGHQFTDWQARNSQLLMPDMEFMSFCLG
jgi:hypothetical protein